MSNFENIVIGFPEPVKMARGRSVAFIENMKSKNNLPIEMYKNDLYMTDEFLDSFKESNPQRHFKLKAQKIEDENSLYEAVIPVKCLDLENNWNIETLSDYLEKIISEMKLYDF